MKTRVRTLVAVVVVLASILAFPTNANAKTTSYAKNSVEAQILAGINTERRAAGLSELKYDADMQDGADTRVSEATQVWSHTRPDGTEYWTADEANIYGENLGKGYSTVNALISAWMASPSHKDNILFGDFETCAIGVMTSSNGTYIVALEFGY